MVSFPPVSPPRPYTPPSPHRSILILFSHLRLGLPSGLFPSGFPTKALYTPSPRPYAPYQNFQVGKTIKYNTRMLYLVHGQVSIPGCRRMQYELTHTNEHTCVAYLRNLKFTLKHLKRSYMFRSYDHPQAAYTVPC